MVNASSSKAVQQAAWKLTWYFSSHVEEMLDQVGLTIPSKKLLASAVYKNKKFSDVFIADMAKSNFVFCHLKGSQIQAILKEMVEGVMLTKVPPAEAAQQGQQKIDDILKQ
jgi:ABC-type glycerol-3-phosphate transport system substrate-binding protein